MPRSRSSKRRSARRRPITYSQIGSKLVSDVRKLKSLLNVEVKHFDVTSSGTLATSSGAATGTLLSGLAQGDGPSDRDGNSVRLQGLSYRQRSEVHATTPESYTQRLLIVQSSFGENTVPTLSDVIDGGSSVLDYRNIEQSRGYKVLVDKTSVINFANPDLRYFEGHIDLNNHLKFDGTAGTDHTYGAIWLWIVDDGPTNHGETAFQSRLRYTDN